MRRLPFVALALALPVLPGCSLGDAIEFSCLFVDDSDHCYQSAAVQNSDPDLCEKIGGEGFSGSNPPRDKCYLQIAENTGDYDVCQNIKGGFMSYTQAECVRSIAVSSEDPAGCKRLSGADFDSCQEAVSANITSDRLKKINEEVEAAQRAVAQSPDDQDARQKLDQLLAQQAGLFEFASPEVQTQFFRESREALMADIDDDDVKSAIAKQFTAYRSSHPGLSLNDQIDQMKEIKYQQETVKRLDEEANTLMDQLKQGASDFATTTLDDLYGDDIEAYKKAMAERGRQYFEENGGKSIKAGIDRLEYLKDQYDKASEQYAAISEQVDKLKKVYDEAAEVYNKIEEVNKLVAAGKIDVNRAKVLHGAIYLSKGLEYATGYIPVFGSTASTISKEVMDATVRFATKRAERTTALDKCIDDPEHCDPNGISPY